MIKDLERVPVKYFKSIKGTTGLFEIRVHVSGDIYRIFSFFDKGKIIILINGFQKKSKKTPKKEIDKAIKLMKEYLDEK